MGLAELGPIGPIVGLAAGVVAGMTKAGGSGCCHCIGSPKCCKTKTCPAPTN